MDQPAARSDGGVDDVSDAVLALRVGARDPQALETLYDRYVRPCYALARRITTDPTFAQDVVQEVFMAVWRDPSKFDATRGGFGSWLLAMTHHKAVDTVRREETLRRRRAESIDNSDLIGRSADSPPVEEQAWTHLRGERVRDAMRALPDVQRQALSLAYFGGYTQREIAALTGAPLGTVKTRMLAGMRRMRGKLGGLSDSTDEEEARQ